jgi:hypothetical protein
LDLSSASWDDLDKFQHLYPSFKLEDELRFEGGRDSMVGLPYFRRNRGAKEQRWETEHVNFADSLQIRSNKL